MTDLRQDLADRWRPSEEQITGAEALTLYHERIWTPHLLLHKEFAIWTDKVQVMPLDGWFLEMERAGAYGRLCAEVFVDAGEKLTVGYTAHTVGRNWAVFEDIMSINISTPSVGVVYGAVYELLHDLLERVTDTEAAEAYETAGADDTWEKHLIDEWLSTRSKADLIALGKDSRRDLDEDHAFWGNEFNEAEEYAEQRVREVLGVTER